MMGDPALPAGLAGEVEVGDVAGIALPARALPENVSGHGAIELLSPLQAGEGDGPAVDVEQRLSVGLSHGNGLDVEVAADGVDRRVAGAHATALRIADQLVVDDGNVGGGRLVSRPAKQHGAEEAVQGVEEAVLVVEGHSTAVQGAQLIHAEDLGGGVAAA